MKKNPTATKKERRYLARLETLVDSIYALVIVIIVAGFPSARHFEGDFTSPWDFLSRHSDELVTPGLGLILILLYWAQSNVQLGSLARTDTVHAMLVIGQLILLLVYVYSVDFLLDFPGDNTVLTAQSVIFLLMGVVSYVAWRRATGGRRLVDDEVRDDEIAKIGRDILPEPLTAFLTIGASFLGSTAWEIAWLAVLPITWVVNRIGKR
jgi:uncharacterized membrane protein